MGSPSNTKSPGPRPSSIPSDMIHAAIWPQQIWAENWGLCPFGGGGAGSPPNTMWPGLRPTCMPSFILIRRTVWPQCTNVTDRTDSQNRTGQQLSDSIGRTVLQTVAQKFNKIRTAKMRKSVVCRKMPQDFRDVVDFLYCLYVQSLHHGEITGKNQSRHFGRNH